MAEETERMSEEDMATRIVANMITMLVTRLGPALGTAVLRQVELQLRLLVERADECDWDPRKYNQTLN